MLEMGWEISEWCLLRGPAGALSVSGQGAPLVSDAGPSGCWAGPCQTRRKIEQQSPSSA